MNTIETFGMNTLHFTDERYYAVDGTPITYIDKSGAPGIFVKLREGDEWNGYPIAADSYKGDNAVLYSSSEMTDDDRIATYFSVQIFDNSWASKRAWLNFLFLKRFL